MGKTGTSVAKEAADIILLDDSFGSIVNAVMWGRSLYRNIQRFILFQLTVNVVALTIAMVGPFIGIDLPLTVIQMLWVNLIMDTFAALALATEPPDPKVMNRPPRKNSAFIVTPAMWRGIFGGAAVFLAALIGLLLHIKHLGLEENSAAGNHWLTIFFCVFVMLQFWNLFNAKCFGTGESIFRHLADNRSFTLITAGILIGQIVMVQFGGRVFRTTPLGIVEWVTIIAAIQPDRLGRRTLPPAPPQTGVNAGQAARPSGDAARRPGARTLMQMWPAAIGAVRRSTARRPSPARQCTPTRPADTARSRRR